jgi:hypothetical protein
LQAAVRDGLVFLACLAGLTTLLSAARGAPAPKPVPVQHTATAESLGV